MARMNVDYDLLTWEGDILRLKFWAQAFEVLKAKRAVHLRTDGRLAGCWVMPIQEDLESTPKLRNAQPQPLPTPNSQATEGTEEDAEEREKVIVRSNGVVTYVGKDIAYQFWKLGLLGRDFNYREFAQRPQGPLWATSQHRRRGQPSAVRRRVVRLQRDRRAAVVSPEAPEAGAHCGRAILRARERSHHFSYEMVALSHATARELGFAPAPDSDDAKRPFVEVSGRKGLGVKADDLLDTVIQKAGEEVAKRNPDLSEAEVAAPRT